eukprot:51240_1
MDKGTDEKSTSSRPRRNTLSLPLEESVPRQSLKRGSVPNVGITSAFASATRESKRTSLTSTDVFNNHRKSALPAFAQQCTFEWKDLNVFVGDDKSGKRILHDFNGSIQSGELLAVMGGSGSGKTTLLHALSGRTNLNQQTVNGSLAINGHQFECSNQDIITSVCAYVPQSDILCPSQTVEEALEFYAQLKLHHVSAAHRQARIEYLIQVLRLETCRKQLIGDEKKRGISGGEKRRVSIASELLNEVDIIFLDEPTSGLDAYTAARTIRTLKQLAVASNKIIIATIHQPSMEVFYLFDKLMLISHGELCFNSDVDNIEPFFKKTLRSKTNPADTIVFDVQRNTEMYAIKWKHSTFNMHQSNAINWEHYTSTQVKLGLLLQREVKSNMAPMRVQLALLFKREVNALRRDKRLTFIRVVQLVFLATITGLCYLDIAARWPAIKTRQSCIFMLGLMVPLFGIMTLLTEFPKQKLLFEREYNSRTYNILPWALSIFAMELPREVLHMTVFSAITKLMIDLDGNVIYYWITFFLMSITGGSFGMLAGVCVKPSVEPTQVVPATIFPLILFSDAKIHVPKFLRWIATINPLYYLYRCMWIIEFDGAVYERPMPVDVVQVCDQYQDYILNYTMNANTSQILDNVYNPEPGVNITIA